MKLKNIKIGTQLRIGLGIIMLFMALLGFISYYQADKLWKETEGLHDHPLTVRRAIGELTNNILLIDTNTKELLIADNIEEKQEVLAQIAVLEENAKKQFPILYDRYLGNKEDVVKAERLFIQWKLSIDENILLIRNGRHDEAEENVELSGKCGMQTRKLLETIKVISDFAVARGDRFYDTAKHHRTSLLWMLSLVLFLVFLLITVISVILIHNIKRPLTELTDITHQYMQGNMGLRIGYNSSNEFGILSSSFNNLAAMVEKELINRQAIAQIAEVLLGEDELHAFSNELLHTLMEKTGSQIGAIYLLNENNGNFEHFQSIGLSSTGRTVFSSADYTGEFGKALATGDIQYIADIPDDTRFKFKTISGDFIPKEIITIPILANQDDVAAVVSLANLNSYTPEQTRVVKDSWKIITARLNGVLAVKKLRTFSSLLEQQNSELDAQKKEMQLQRDELSEQNVELELQKNQLDEASRLKSAFLSNMSHELRTPLNSVIALSSVLNRRLKGVIEDEEYSYIDVIERNGKALLSLINDILDLSRIEAGREEIVLSRFSIREIINDVAIMIEPQAREKGIELTSLVTSDISPIRSDFTKCRHILQNIIGNAVKFTDAGSVTITAEEISDAITIIVKDTGIGIPEDKIEFIFDEFRQADESMTRLYGGSGLGLAIADKYVGMLQGNIKVDSKPGVGSIFRITLPLSINVPDIAERAALEIDRRMAITNNRPAGNLPVGGGKSILIVEDSEPAIIQLTDIIVNQGYHVRIARNGNEAIHEIEQMVPDAVILDLMMPEIDGFDVLRSIRGSEKTSQLPVIILTAKHVTADELSFLKGNHIHQLIQKGDISKNDLLAAIGKMVEPAEEIKITTPHVMSQRSIEGRPIILVVEDNPDNMITVKALLKDDYDVIEAEDGQIGVKQAIDKNPHLILMDISLPVMDGIKALQAIRAIDELRDIPVVALTASAMKGNREEILAYGFDGYIAKPIDEDVLIKTIVEKINGRR
jgi:signal transduction histidine kinase/CheY-like chemotaxis protein/CHASE3 domain sensor protein